METLQLLLLLLLGLQSHTNCLKLPTYIKACSRNDPNINACAKQHAIEAIPHFVNGDPKYRVPVLDPLHIEELSVTQGSSNFGLNFTLKNLTVKGLKDMQVKDIRMDLTNQHIVYDLFIPSVHIDCQYNVSGQVLVLPINGNGNGVLKFKDVDLSIDYYYEKMRKTAGGKEYVLPSKFKFTNVPHGMTIHLDNLFNGNKFLGDNMNTILNENWEKLVQDLAPAFGEALGEIVKRILTNIFVLVPYDEAFPEKV